MRFLSTYLLGTILLQRTAVAFLQLAYNRPALTRSPPSQQNPSSYLGRHTSATITAAGRDSLTVQLETTLDDAKVTALFAWICRAFDGDDDGDYNNLMLAVAAIFGNLPTDSRPVLMAQRAVAQMNPDPDALQGASFSLRERQSASLGAMGAAQWTGQWRTRPHALLSLHNLTDVSEWDKSLPRGCRRTLQRAVQQNFTVTTRPILNDRPAPHSSLAHFRCVVEHEVRLLTAKSNTNEAKDGIYSYESSPQAFLDALAQAVSRFMGTTQMAGVIQEYRDEETNRVIAFAHEVQKGRTVRGQWFYATDQASKSYVWFHSVRSLVERAIANDKVTVVDLGPSGSDGFSELKAKYGFLSVEDWPAVADYEGPFWDFDKNQPVKNGVTY